MLLKRQVSIIVWYLFSASYSDSGCFILMETRACVYKIVCIIGSCLAQVQWSKRLSKCYSGIRSTHSRLSSHLNVYCITLYQPLKHFQKKWVLGTLGFLRISCSVFLSTSFLSLFSILKWFQLISMSSRAVGFVKYFSFVYSAVVCESACALHEGKWVSRGSAELCSNLIHHFLWARPHGGGQVTKQHESVSKVLI